MSRHPTLRGLAAVALLGACSLSERPYRAPVRGGPVVEVPDDAATAPDGRSLRVPREADPAIAQSDPVDLGSTSCPGTRLLRVERRHTGAPPGAPGLMPRYYGRDDLGHVLSMPDVLACELRAARYVERPMPEPTNVILWHGPWAFSPDDDCDWREPVRIESAPHGGRRVTFVERCRRRATGSGGDHTTTLEVTSDYRLSVH